MWKYSPLKTIFILGPMVFSFALAMDIYMPVLPEMQKALHTSQQMVQITLSLFLIVTGVGQLILGPLSDQFGRFKIVLISSILFLFGSILCAISTSIDFLIFSRVIQAIGCCGLSVCAFAIIRDAFSGKTSSMIYSLINAIISVSPIVGPLIGVQLATHFEWNSAFILLSAMASIVLLTVIFLVKESLPIERRKKVSWNVFLRYFEVLKSLQFWAYSLTAVSGMSAFFILFSMTPYIITYLGFPISKIYIMFGSAGVAFLFGSLFAGGIVNALGVHKTALLGVVLVFIAGSLSLGIYLVYGLSLWGFFAPCFFATFGCALVVGTGASGAMEPFYEMAGVAAALFGTMEFALSGVIGSIAMLFPATSSLPIAITMLLMSSLSFILLLLVKNKA
ncbi:multidrug effflux MFS transporter [Francisella adeliensis]|uniref:Bcr/CflA family efflux transporter n=1 Tax=Francisella adeliensis TaxID=2007306 RepID=A0A2Z4XXK0_9GAMM|nr:multidrug effflux MFS transporter [Francisella adeliensis]AXA33338.1 Bcr/CflA family drug resistance efflux transporter [Francisella adeliensis]MBK2085350.1 multidrug effflux MFS transporter [Francisella adeliensis]MBK2097080.1 multidrug effflux MFS transporter [Francisella adeliensis]QIW11567.1 multidrug effflux MFS transporter [Francisella adeliensis]QIW13442.1 multidrug effflux MFS transporter [Francisella adeliensis]